MKLLHIADLHLGRFLDGRPRWDEQEAVLDEIVAIARREEVDLVLAAGDVFDSFIPPARAEELSWEMAAPEQPESLEMTRTVMPCSLARSKLLPMKRSRSPTGPSRALLP